MLTPQIAQSFASEPQTLTWTTVPHRPLDVGGPVDVPFSALDQSFTDTDAVAHLRTIAHRYGAKIAISDGVHEFTYTELYQTVIRLSEMIMAAVPAGQAVGLLLPNSAWYPVAFFACMAAGRPAVPLSARDPGRRNAEIIAAARLPAIVAIQETMIGVTSNGTTWIDIAAAWNTRDEAASRPQTVSVDAPALVLYTSGSTGRPKGICNSQRAMLQRVLQHVNACHINSDDVLFPLSGPTT